MGKKIKLVKIGKHTESTLGRALYKSRFGHAATVSGNSEKWLHTADLDDSADWNKLNMKSVTEQNSLDEFLTTAEMAGTDFESERLNLRFVKPKPNVGVLDIEEEKKIKDLQAENVSLLCIPRRPVWKLNNYDAATLHLKERESFLEWRRNLARAQENEKLAMTPFEKNLDFWRQLWRVIEKSDIIVQIVDARNPLLFYCQDLEKYVKEVDESKMNIVLINKSDFLTERQRLAWLRYFKRQSVRVVFWSAAIAAEIDDLNDLKKLEERDRTDSECTTTTDDDSNVDPNRIEEESDENDSDEDNDDDDDDDDDANEEEEIVNKFKLLTDEKSDQDEGTDEEKEEEAEAGAEAETEAENNRKTNKSDDKDENEEDENTSDNTDAEEAEETLNKSDAAKEACRIKQEAFAASSQAAATAATVQKDDLSELNVTEAERDECRILTGHELVHLFKTAHAHVMDKAKPGCTTIGLVGYPNVGKSSTLNAILKTKRAAVSETPGKTKHYQTFFVDDQLMLCDCPGLVFPSFVTTRGELIINGILPIDQMREYVQPTNIATILQVIHHIPKNVMEMIYGIDIPKPREGHDQLRLPSAEELCSAYAIFRGYMNHKAMPDVQRSARYILKDYVNGKLLYCYPPPGVDAVSFQDHRYEISKEIKYMEKTKKLLERSKGKKAQMTSFDNDFFSAAQPRALTKGGIVGYHRASHTVQRGADMTTGGVTADTTNKTTAVAAAEGKTSKKHFNINKREKLRRKTSHFDQTAY